MSKQGDKSRKTPKNPGWKAIVMAERREQAEQRQAKRNKRTHKEQLFLLDERVGKDGAKKERTRLRELIKEARKAKAQKTKGKKS